MVGNNRSLEPAVAEATCTNTGSLTGFFVCVALLFGYCTGKYCHTLVKPPLSFANQRGCLCCQSL